jgi:outer membrane protein TolC
MAWLRNILVSVLVVGQPLLAQVSDPTPPNFSIRLEKEAQPLALKTAIQTALAQNQNILKARNTIERAEAGVRAARAAWLPSVSATSFYSGQQGGSSSGNFTNSLGTSGIVDWTAYDAARQARIDLALLQLDKARLDLKTQERNLALQVTEAYFDLQLADSTATIQAASVRESEANLEQTRKRLAAGTATRFDLLQQEVQLANNRQRLLASLNDQSRSRLVLADLLNLALSLPVRAADPVDPNPDYTRSLVTTLEEALRLRPELTTLERDIVIANTNQVVNTASVLPRLTISTSYNYNNNLRNFSQDNLIVSANLRWLLFDGGAVAARNDQFEFDKQNSRLDISITAQRLRTDIERAYLAKESAKAQMASANVAIGQATESLTLARRRFAVGVGLQVEVITAERALTEARQNYTNAVITYNRALAQLNLILGVS